MPLAPKLCAVEELVSSARPPPPPLNPPLTYHQQPGSGGDGDSRNTPRGHSDAHDSGHEAASIGQSDFRRWPSPWCVVPALPAPAFISGERGVVFNATHALTNARWHRKALPRVDGARLRLMRLDVPVVNLVIQWGEEYQHAVLETLPRLALVSAALRGGADALVADRATASDSRCLLEAREALARLPPVDWQRAVLLHSPGAAVRRLLQAGLGWPAARLIEADPATIYSTPLAIFPTLAHQAKIGVMPPGVYGPLLTALRPEPQSARPLLLYLRRSPEQARGLAPEVDAQVVALLQRRLRPAFDLQVWNTSSSAVHSFETDAAAFARARVVLGPHGGAFANLVFAPPGAEVIEFIPRASMEMQAPGEPKRDVRPCYHALAGALGLRYHQLEPLPSGAGGNFFDMRHMRINVSALASLLVRLGVLEG